MNSSARSADSTSLRDGVALALLAHIGWGCYPPLSKLLLKTLPPLALLTVTSGIALVVTAMWGTRQLGKQLWRQPFLWTFVIVLVARSLTNILSVKLTLATYVQLINIMTPFPTAILGSLIFHEPIPRGTFRAISLCLVGAAMMLAQHSPNGWGLRWGPTDAAGVSVAILSTLFLALYALLARRATFGQQVPPMAVFLQQCVGQFPAMLVASLLVGEDWTAWGRLTPPMWLAFAAFAGLVMLGANLLQIVASQKTNATLQTSLIGIRLVVALALAAILLGESFLAPWQLAGAALVVGTITVYLWKQRS